MDELSQYKLKSYQSKQDFVKWMTCQAADLSTFPPQKFCREWKFNYGRVR